LLTASVAASKHQKSSGEKLLRNPPLWRQDGKLDRAPDEIGHFGRALLLALSTWTTWLNSLTYTECGQTF
jgi:hypothetical protein